MQTLERLHSELGGQILENKTEALRSAYSMRHVEAVIKMLDPAFNLRRISVKRRQTNPVQAWHRLPPRCGCHADGHRDGCSSVGVRCPSMCWSKAPPRATFVI